MIKKRAIRVIAAIMTAFLFLAGFAGLTACGRLEEREDYLEENGWIAFITSEDFKTAKLIGNKEQSVVNGEAILPTHMKGYDINRIQDNGGVSLTISCFDFIPDKLFIPGVNYVFSDKIVFPYANKKVIFLGSEPSKYSNGFNTKKDTGTNYPYEKEQIYYVPKSSLNDFENLYSGCTDGEFRGANVSYFYNYEDAPNGGYHWIDDLDAGNSIITIPSAPQRDGFTFDGWYLDKECTTKFNFETYKMSENSELELFAKWLPC